ncbi:Putative P-loop containing nucleoside triphosphate hydrolase [Septoria linicola]|uniref:P-loop containing nucleoside triphosphate hydrolase n=1 Tax=Septoria linicola TaxID=215465 RepID=A0A9Q9B9Z1_9PEZI|nr:putative P-loop containing nucleoside triphosphate hydrolase [Septoria linicola]USW59081.1 Putative P-loop containing nucleoside triphosphate hydrolase [Septoria linicola]
MSTTDAEATGRNGVPPHPPSRCMLITIPRSCSNLLVRILALDRQEHIKHGGYHFLHTMIHMSNDHLIDNAPETWSDEQKLAIHELIHGGISKLEEDVKFEDDTTTAFTKEHCHTLVEPTHISRFVNGPPNKNEPESAPLRWSIPGYESLYTELNETILPDAYLLSWRPVFLIRHPIRVFESAWGSMNDVFKHSAETMTRGSDDKSKEATIKANMTYKFHRTLYNFYVSRGVRPILIDADDLIVHTQAITQKLAQQIGLDPSKLLYEWEALSEAELAKQEVQFRIMLSSLHASKGVQADKLGCDAGTPTEQVPRWTEKFGEKAALELKERVEASLADYEWLCKRKMSA